MYPSTSSFEKYTAKWLKPEDWAIIEDIIHGFCASNAPHLVAFEALEGSSLESEDAKKVSVPSSPEEIAVRWIKALRAANSSAKYGFLLLLTPNTHSVALEKAPSRLVNREDFVVDYGPCYMVEKSGFHYKPEDDGRNYVEMVFRIALEKRPHVVLQQQPITPSERSREVEEAGVAVQLAQSTWGRCYWTSPQTSLSMERQVLKSKERMYEWGDWSFDDTMKEFQRGCRISAMSSVTELHSRF